MTRLIHPKSMSPSLKTGSLAGLEWNARLDRPFYIDGSDLTGRLGMPPHSDGGSACSIEVDNVNYSVLNTGLQNLIAIRNKMGVSSLSFLCLDHQHICFAFQSDRCKERFGAITDDWFLKSSLKAFSLREFGVRQPVLTRDLMGELHTFYVDVFQIKGG